MVNTASLLLFDIGEPCFDLNMRYHCPFMMSLISSNQNTNVPIELSGNMTKETMKTSAVPMFSIGILYPITTLINMLII